MPMGRSNKDKKKIRINIRIKEAQLIDRASQRTLDSLFMSACGNWDIGAVEITIALQMIIEKKRAITSHFAGLVFLNKLTVSY
jgi:hypothetical protein